MTIRPALLVAGFVVAVATATAQRPSLASGLDPRTFDTSVRPQDDLFRYVNGGWIRATPLPPERVTYGTFEELAERAEGDIHSLIEDIVASPDRHAGSEPQQIADLYTSMLDVARLEARGIAPIEPELRRIDAIQTTSALAAEAGRLSSIAGGGPFDGIVGQDASDSSALVFRLLQGGTLMADRAYYLRQDSASGDIRAQYLRYLGTIFRLAGRPAADDDARAVLALETDLARAQLPRPDARDGARAGKRFWLGDLRKTFPGFDWMAWARPQGIDRVSYVIVSQPSFFKTFAAMIPATPLATWRAWLAARYITAMAPFLTEELNDARFEFFGRVLTGQDAARARWRRGVGIVSAYLGDAIGRRYVERHFPPPARARVERIVDHVIEAYRQAIVHLDWMAPSSRRAALAKLFALTTTIGYPDEWRDYRGLVVKPDDLIGNVERARQFENDYRMTQLGATEGRGGWTITPQVVDAYYNASTNEIVLPAAMLQPPLFNPDADDAVNYGGIGAIVGHEIGHAFDTHGRFVDGRGAARDWWTPGDVQRFAFRARALVEQFDAYSPLEGLHVSGGRTLDENLGDLGGLAIAYQAYRISLGGRPAPVIDGLTGDERFFMGWAQAWRAKSTDGYVRQMLLVDPHAPPEFRANGPVGHLQAFYDAFGVKPGDGLYRAPDARVKIW